MARTPKALASSRGKGSAEPANARLEIKDWVNAALIDLANKGIAGVGVESLARKLGVTKGSFYWHFKDRDALLFEMLQAWRKRATLLVMERLERDEATPLTRLEGLLRFPFISPRAAEGSDVELAIRMWGRDDARARQALGEIDELRMRFITSIFTALGQPPTAAEARAALVYSFMRIAPSLPTQLETSELIENIMQAVADGKVTTANQQN